MRAALAATLSLLGLISCNKHSDDGLPPSDKWQTDDPAVVNDNAIPGAMRPHSAGGGGGDPHSGMLGGGGGGGGGSDPHAGVPGAPPLGGGGQADPHAGVPGAPPLGAGDMGGGPHGDPNMPHGDVAAALDVTALGLSRPDPNRAIDPSRRIKGVIKLSAKTKGLLQPGVAIFLVVKKAGADGQPMGSAIAVDKLDWSGDSLAFELTQKHAMVAGAPDLIGDLLMIARSDQDSDAITRQPGDITGMTRVKVPADGVVVELDTVLK